MIFKKHEEQIQGPLYISRLIPSNIYAKQITGATKQETSLNKGESRSFNLCPITGND